ncbi:MAG: ABC transporter ATP-binding protein/permease [Synechococcales bacterium]|nr:ABC transporter ATP-binding protein/permease [Synechococcales bacterium]
MGEFWHLYWPLVRPFWHSPQRWQAVGLLLVAVVASVGSSVFLVWESLQRGEFISALAARDGERFERAAWLLVGVLVGSALLLSLSTYLRDRLGLAWRRWLTRSFLDRYLEGQRFYRLGAQTAMDNPDQRISEDAKHVTQLSVAILGIGLESAVQLVGFISVLWSVSVGMTLFLGIYGIVGSAIALLFFGRKLTGINAEQLKREANFRFGLMDVREQAESIAFYRGQGWERQRLGDRFQQAVQNFNRLIRWQLGLDFFQNGYQYLTFILPSLILAPQIFSGELEVGALVQSQAAFDRIWLSLSLIIIQFEQLTALAASVGRLSGLAQALQVTSGPVKSQQIAVVSPAPLAVEHLTLLTPDGQRQLVTNLSFRVPSGHHLLICGASGLGKSSLTKAIAGLWSVGSGTLYRPQRREILFLPQQPYLVLGSLRQQLLYPYGDPATDEAELRHVLQQVELADLSKMNLDTVADWGQRLSVGEQQRLAFARLLLFQPTYAVLDEATSALAIDQEKHLYDQLSQTDITYISVGHRSSLVPYHRQQLTLSPNQRWALEPIPSLQTSP